MFQTLLMYSGLTLQFLELTLQVEWGELLYRIRTPVPDGGPKWDELIGKQYQQYFCVSLSTPLILPSGLVSVSWHAISF